MKAKFQTTLGRHKSHISHSNMPLKRTIPKYLDLLSFLFFKLLIKSMAFFVRSEDLPDYVWDEFETTVPMSTYILVFIVSEFQGVDSPVSNPPHPTQFRVWTRPSASEQTE